MVEIYKISLMLIKICGPLAVLCLVLMFSFLTAVNKKPPKPGQVIYLYAKYHLERKKHAGILTYLFIVCSIFFFLSVVGLLLGRILNVG